MLNFATFGSLQYITDAQESGRLTISDYLGIYVDAYETAILTMSFYDVTTQWKSGEV